MSESNVKKMIALLTPKGLPAGWRDLSTTERTHHNQEEKKRRERGRITGDRFLEMKRFLSRRNHTKETYTLISPSKVLMYLINERKVILERRNQSAFSMKPVSYLLAAEEFMP